MDRLDRDLRDQHGMTLQEYEILVRLSEAPDRTMRMAVLASQATLSRSRLTHTIGRMEAADIVRRAACSEDGRGVEATLTDHGLEVLAKAADTHVRSVQDHVLAHASDQELSVVGDVMERILVDLHGKRF